ncbi:hypothetical protein V5799_024569 [Amblyomma americanum]|uniref:Uncharacterized protein n=1 Tax=Amblyomma americanum TaxID=6943 RepID=A0AAQ4EBS1_AMBAM
MFRDRLAGTISSGAYGGAERISSIHGARTFRNSAVHGQDSCGPRATGTPHGGKAGEGTVCTASQCYCGHLLLAHLAEQGRMDEESMPANATAFLCDPGTFQGACAYPMSVCVPYEH